MTDDRKQATRDIPIDDADIVEQLEYWEGEYHYPAGLLTVAAEEIKRLRSVLNDVRAKG
jgi:hypothetical protein